MIDEGYIKFNFNWIKAEPLPSELLSEINRWRDILFQHGLIGVYDDGIGFGNISIRHKGKTFIISGSATGGIKKLDEHHYTVVSEYSHEQNSLTCIGPIVASSESLTHAAIYESDETANAVIHVHSISLWEKLMHNVPTTAENVPYGTPEMANEIKRLFQETDVKTQKIIVMAGHREGIIVFGETLDEAGKVLMDRLK